MTRGSAVWNVFWRFLLLGCSSFGGPAAHLGYFHRYFVEQHAWLSSKHYAELVALSQFLPGPSSSQVGFAIGLHRAGLAGGIVAFLGFTLPSFCLMLMFARYMFLNSEPAQLMAIIHGLKLLAVVVLTEVIYSMGRQFCRTTVSQIIALFSTLILLADHSLFMQLALLFAAAGLGALLYRQMTAVDTEQVIYAATKPSLACLTLFTVLLFTSYFITLTLGTDHSSWPVLAAQFYQSGSLVFGGGHVVLPLLQQTVGQSIESGTFLAGYAAAQGMPGPMFSLSAYLGALIMPGAPVGAALVATVAIFLPGLLLIYALRLYWGQLVRHFRMAGAIAAINASVTGLLISTWITPVMTSSLLSFADVVVAVLSFLLLKIFKIPLPILLIGFALYGIVTQ